MSTPAQISANRENAQNSTGPVTETGRATSSRNSLTHGLTAKILSRLPQAVQDEFFSHRDELVKLFMPQNHLEETLLEAYAFALFQQQRAAAYEFVAMEEALANPDDVELRLKWENLMRIVSTKMREAARTRKALDSAMQNRMIAKAVSDEFDKEVPSTTPFVQTCSPKTIRGVINPYTLSLSSLFPTFEPKEPAKDPKS